MNNRFLQIFLVYFAGLLQGVALVTFPAAGTLLTNPQYHGLTSAEYGRIFLPMILGAIASSLAAGHLSSKWGLRSVFLIGLFCNLVSLSLFALTELLLSYKALDNATLLFSLFFLGLGFGSTLTTLNAFVAVFFPKKISSGMTALHTLLGMGTAIAPLSFTFFAKRGSWWGDPLTLALLFFCLLLLSAMYVTNANKQKSVSAVVSSAGKPLLLLFLVVVFLYGICETTFGNWATIYLHQDKGLSMQDAAYALSAFWGMVTVGRILVTGASFWVAPTKIYITLPVIIFLAFWGMHMAQGSLSNILLFGFAGLGCSACLPLSIGFAEHDFSAQAPLISGRMIASYMFGYGVAAYGIGFIQESLSLSLSNIYTYSACIALLLAVLIAFLLKIRRSGAPQSEG